MAKIKTKKGASGPEEPPAEPDETAKPADGEPAPERRGEITNPPGIATYGASARKARDAAPRSARESRSAWNERF